MKLEDKIVRGSSGEYLLGYGEAVLYMVSSHEREDKSAVYIYKAVFDPEFTYNTGYIYVNVSNLGCTSRSVKYFRTPEEAERVAFTLYKESV